MVVSREPKMTNVKAYILTTRYISGLFFLFCLDEESNPITLCIVQHESYLYVKSNKRHDARRVELEGEKLAIKRDLESASIAQPKPIEMLKFHDAQHYSENPITHYKVYVEHYKDLAKVKKLMLSKSYAVAEYPMDENKLFADLKMKPCQWIEFDISDTTPIALREYERSRQGRELAIKSSSIRSCANSDTMAPPRVLEMTFDCETYSARYGIDRSLSMPDPLVYDDILYCVSIVLTWSDSSGNAGAASGGDSPTPIKTYCICVHDNDMRSQNPEEEIVSVPDEEELFRRFFDIIRTHDPDVIYGHNSSCYDFGYIRQRTVMMMDLPSFGRLEPFQETIALHEQQYDVKLDILPNEQYRTESYEGAGGTWHEYHIPNCYGRIILDTLIMLKKLKASPGTPGELQSHALKDLGMFLVGESKTDMTYAETFFSYRSGDTARITKICEYCIQDSRLCMKIYHRTKCWIAVRESASIFYQDANKVTITGQTTKSYTNFLRTGEEMGFAYYPIARNQEFKLKGGYVEKPLKGKHTNVAVLDFASMYPTAQQAYNICMSTGSKMPPAGCTPDDYVKMEIPVEVGTAELPASYEEYTGPNDEDIDPERLEDDDYIDAIMKWNHFNPDYRGSVVEMLRRDHGLSVIENLQTMVFYFVKSSKRAGILPTIQANLTKARGAYKKLMKEAEKRGDTVDKEMYDQRQQLVKVVMNSIYGCLGAAVGRMSFPEGAAAITYVGRSSIQRVRGFLVGEGCRIIYGDTDSLMFQIPGYSDANPELGCAVTSEVIATGNRLTETINATLPKPMMMEFEKVINAVFIDKKRYVGYITWPLADGQGPKVFVRGAASVRGDTTPFARRLYTSVLGMILEDKTKDEVEQALATSLEQLRSGEVPNAMLSVSKMLAHSYASPSAPMNVYARYLVSIGELAEAGTKIPLIVTKQSRGGPRSLSYRLPTTEEPIDYEYYAEMARRPLDKLLEAAFIVSHE